VWVRGTVSWTGGWAGRRSISNSTDYTRRLAPSFGSVSDEVLVQRVKVCFVGWPPVQRIERASGVSEVEVDGFSVRCTVPGSFQPFLEALHGHEVTSLASTSHPRS
jgi:hypothetical protein